MLMFLPPLRRARELNLQQFHRDSAQGRIRGVSYLDEQVKPVRLERVSASEAAPFISPGDPLPVGIEARGAAVCLAVELRAIGPLEASGDDAQIAILQQRRALVAKSRKALGSYLRIELCTRYMRRNDDRGE